MVKTIFKVMSGLDMVTSGFIVGETGPSNSWRVGNRWKACGQHPIQLDRDYKNRHRNQLLVLFGIATTSSSSVTR
jgi:hypothetical protein